MTKNVVDRLKIRRDEHEKEGNKADWHLLNDAIVQLEYREHRINSLGGAAGGGKNGMIKTKATKYSDRWRRLYARGYNYASFGQQQSTKIQKSPDAIEEFKTAFIKTFGDPNGFWPGSPMFTLARKWKEEKEA